ncbi:MAG: EamA family transporter [Alkalinema sp. RU_4_3]|nr:EamA family transporter [Alkalinema sp. RU_4_3]
MSFASFCLLIASVLASVGGQFFLKMGANQLGKVNASNVMGTIVSMVTTWQILVGLTFYGLGVVTYILLLNKVKISVASPALATSYIFAVLLGRFYFGDQISIPQYVGIGFIFFGVILLTQSTQ